MIRCNIVKRKSTNVGTNVVKTSGRPHIEIMEPKAVPKVVDNQDARIAMVTTFIYDTVPEKVKAFHDICLESQSRHAERLEYTHIIIRSKDPKYPHPSWCRFDCYDILENYDAVLWVDSDIYIRHDSPSPIDHYPLTGVTAMDSVRRYGYMSSYRDAVIERYKIITAKAGIYDEVYAPGWNKDPHRYINAGVMIVPSPCRNLFSPPSKYVNDDRCWEQTFVNLRINTMNFLFNDMHAQWNAGHVHRPDGMAYAVENGKYVHFNTGKPNERFDTLCVLRDRYKENNDPEYEHLSNMIGAT